MKHTQPVFLALFTLALTVLLAVALSVFPAHAALASGDVTDPPVFITPPPMPKAVKGDLIVGAMPVPTDVGGVVTVRLPLLYKGMPARGGGLGSLEIWPVLTDENSPFEVTSTSDLKTLMDMKTDIVNGIAVDYVEFALPVKKDTFNDYYKLTFHARYLNMWQDHLREQPAEDDLVIQVKIGGFVQITPTPRPTREPTPTPPPQPVPKIIIEKFLIDPTAIMAGEEFDLTLSLRNTSDKADVSNIKCTLDGGEAVVPVSGSNTFYVDQIGKASSFETKLRMAAQPNASPKPHPVKVTMDYEYRTTDLKEASMTETFTLKVQQTAKLVIDKPRCDPTELFEGEEFNLIMGMFNKGKATLYNVSVTIDNDVFTPEQQTYFVGTMAPGASATYDSMVMVGGTASYEPEGKGEAIGGEKILMTDNDSLELSMAAPVRAMPAGGMSIDGFGGGGGAASGLSGPVTADVVVTFEDENGKETEMRMPFTVTVLAQEPAMDPSMMGAVGPDGKPIVMGPDGMPVMNNGMGETQPTLFGVNRIYVIYGGIGAGVLVVAAAIVLLVRRARRKKEA